MMTQNTKLDYPVNQHALVCEPGNDKMVDVSIIIFTASQSKMISRRLGGGTAGVFLDTLRTLTTTPTKIEL